MHGMSAGGQKRSAHEYYSSGGAGSPRQAAMMEQQMQKRRKLLRKQVVVDGFKLSTQRGYEMAPTKNGKEPSLLFTKLPAQLRKRASLLRSRIGKRCPVCAYCMCAATKHLSNAARVL